MIRGVRPIWEAIDSAPPIWELLLLGAVMPLLWWRRIRAWGARWSQSRRSRL